MDLLYDEQVVLDMLSNALEINNIYFDNSCTSVKLMKVLLEKHMSGSKYM